MSDSEGDTQPVVRDFHSDDAEIMEVESLCMNCHKNVSESSPVFF